MTVLLRFEKFALIVSNVKVVIFWQFILGSPVFIAEWGALKRSTKSPTTKNPTTTRHASKEFCELTLLKFSNVGVNQVCCIFPINLFFFPEWNKTLDASVSEDDLHHNCYHLVVLKKTLLLKFIFVVELFNVFNYAYGALKWSTTNRPTPKSLN